MHANPSRFPILLSALLFLGSTLSQAAKAPADAKELEKQSTHIVTGKVVDVTSKVQGSAYEKAVGMLGRRAFKEVDLKEHPFVPLGR